MKLKPNVTLNDENKKNQFENKILFPILNQMLHILKLLKLASCTTA